MLAQDIRNLVHQRPFRPFRITLTDGRAYDIRHPEFAMVGRSTVIVGLPGTNGEETIFDRFKIVDLLRIMEAEPIDSEAT